MQKEQEFLWIMCPSGHSLKGFEIYISEIGCSSLVWKNITQY